MANLSAFVTKNYNAIKSFKASETSAFSNKLGDKVNEMLESESIYRIYNGDYELKFKCVDCSFSESAEIPQLPLDSNSTISDNVIFTNIQFNCNVIVDYDDLVEFLEQLKVGNLSNEGFTIETISNFETNMFWNNRNYSETTDSTGSVYLSLSFVKVKFVEPKTGYLSYKKVPKPEDASEVKSGKVNIKSNVDPKRARMEEARNQSILHETRENIRKYGWKNGVSETFGKSAFNYKMF